jgi:NADPH:quinone reductase-like Zn-dependent oxidoreductase
MFALTMNGKEQNLPHVKTMKAIKTISDHKSALQIVPIPTLRDDYILVKVETVALNPTDWYRRRLSDYYSSYAQ